MKVILTSKIKNLGNIGDIKVVADGYSKNYLLPRKLAVPYSDENFKVFETKKALLEKDNQEKLETALKTKDQIDGLEVVILENAGDNDKLYGAISSLRIANKINELIGHKCVLKSNVIIAKPIKELGKVNIRLELHNDVVLDKEIYIVRSMEDVNKLKLAEIKAETPKTEENNKTSTTENSVK